ncbi:TonB-dependent receptor plug domain-containing protein [Roseovarius confluentis]|uniref:TonB-dependent receptor plug domain-containing protein n=1 Tax=Roseovarius confluentis TaxID=1852027 RepID=UPI000CDE1249|nr:TonB-dependent receptor [Roseovarius confluentis]
MGNGIRKTSAWVISLAGAAVGTFASAQEEPFELPEIVLPPAGGAGPISEAASTKQVITSEEFERQGARTLGEALDLANGINVRFGGDGTRRIDIRGLRTRQVLLLVDGVPVRSSIDGQFDPDRFALGGVDRIEITRGASSVLYGPGASAGVVNLITKDGGKGLSGSFGVATGTGGTNQVEGSIAYGSDRGNLRFSGTWSGRDDYPLSDDFTATPVQPNGDRINSDREETKLLASGVYRLNSDTSIGFSATYSEGEYGKPPSIYDRAVDDFASRTRFERVENYSVRGFQIVGTHQVGTLTFTPRLYYSEEQEFTKSYDDAGFDTQTAAGSFTEDATSTIWGSQLLVTSDLNGAGQLSGMLGYEHQDWSASGIERVSGGGGGGGGGGVTQQPINTNASAEILSAGIEYEFRPVDPLGLVVGLGYAQQTRNGQTDGDTYYRIAATYDLDSQTTLRAQHAREIRFPTLRDLFAADRGNPNLDPERTLHYEVGIDRSFAFWNATLSASLFQTDAKDYIERGPSGLSENVEKLRMRGLEIDYRASPIEPLTVGLGYTFLDAENRSVAAPSRDLQNRPRHKFVLSGSYRFNGGTRIDAQYLAVLDNLTLNRNGTQSRNVGDFHLVDLGVTHAFEGQNAEIYGRVRNLFDEDYQDSYGFVQAGRTFQVGGRIRF